MAPRSLTLFEKVDTYIGFVQALISTLVTAIVAPFRGSNTPKTWSRHVLLTASRKVLSRLSPEQLQSITGTTESNYLAYTKSKQLPQRSIQIPNFNTKAFWMGDPKADTIVIYYHGGGFAISANDGHMFTTSTLVSRATKANKSVAVLLLQYDLCPGEKYPRQITQAVELLRYTIETLGKSPDKIMLAGDSSGGHLIFSVLSHLMHPHPSIKPLKLSKPLKSVMLSSPVTVLNTDHPRFRTHEAQDPASAETIGTWLKNLLGSSPPDSWNQPLTNNAKWWSGLDKVVESMLITVATNEMMAANIGDTADVVKSAYSKLTLFKSEVDFHAEPGIGPALGMEEGEASKVIISWVIDRS